MEKDRAQCLRDIDMEEPFNEIVLSRGEEKALKLLSKHCLIAEDIDADKKASRLVRLKLAERFHTTYNGQPRIGIRLNDRGRDYFMYLKREKSGKRTQSMRYWITTGIAVAALILSVAALLWQAYTWRHELQDGETGSSRNIPGLSISSSISESIDCNTSFSSPPPFFS